ncbi:MAG: helix-hairpin-helix domain-containing protein [Burkholderiales bacterium]
MSPLDRAAAVEHAPPDAPSMSPAMHFGPRVKPRKATRPSECEAFEQLPNVGPAMAADLRAIGVAHPRELGHRDPFVLYQSLCAHTGKRQDPCVLDTFMAITDFMRGAAPAPWWTYTAQRKVLYGSV